MRRIVICVKKHQYSKSVIVRRCDAQVALAPCSRTQADQPSISGQDGRHVWHNQVAVDCCPIVLRIIFGISARCTFRWAVVCSENQPRALRCAAARVTSGLTWYDRQADPKLRTAPAVQPSVCCHWFWSRRALDIGIDRGCF